MDGLGRVGLWGAWALFFDMRDRVGDGVMMMMELDNVAKEHHDMCAVQPATC